MALPFTPYKRTFEPYATEPNGRGKWQRTCPSVPQSSQFKVPPGTIVFRVLCPSSKSGSVIGKKGGIIAQIRRETHAKIKLEEIVPGCDERIVVISGSTNDSEFSNEQTKQDDSDSNADGGDDGKASLEDGKAKEDSIITEDSKLVKETSLVQKALLLIFERIIEGEPENDEANGANKKSSPSMRLLVFPNQVGCLLGKGGSVMKKMSTDSGAQIRILPRDKLPLCASSHHEIVQITGGVDSIRKALQSISQQLMENSTHERDFTADNPSGSSHSYAPIPHPEDFNQTNYHMPVQGPPFPNRPPADAPDLLSFPRFHEGTVTGQMPVGPEVLVFRLFCSNDKVGSVIGKGGNIVKTLQHETGCEIKILETSETENRIIVIFGPVLPGDRISPPQDAVLRVQHRIFLAVPATKDNAALSWLLVTPNQTGCLLGKGGSIIAEMRKLSGAQIRVLSKDQTPKGVPENDEVVQVCGEFGAVQEALLLITARLRNHFFRDKVSALNHPALPSLLDRMPPFGSYMGRRKPSPPRFYGDLSLFQKDAGALALEERSAFGLASHDSGVPPLGKERVPPAPWDAPIARYLVSRFGQQKSSY